MLHTLLLMVGLAQARPAALDTPGFGVGVVIGNPTGLSLSWRREPWNAVQAGAGWNLLEGRLDTSLDYLRTVNVVPIGNSIRMPLYVGLGGKVTAELPGFAQPDRLFTASFGHAAGAAARVPLGASMFFDRVPIEVFAQVIPYLRVLPYTSVGIDEAIGGRYYF